MDVLQNRRDVLIETYYETFRESLENMQHSCIPTLKEIKDEITSRELYGFFSSYSFLPMVAMRKEDSADTNLEALADKEFARKKVKVMFSSNPRTVETLKYALKRFDKLGIFD